jgi:glucose/arabinose dehydrogenase
MLRYVLLLVGLASMLSCSGGDSATINPPVTRGGSAVTISLATVASGFTSPLDVEQPRDNSGRLFVVEQAGRIKIIQNNVVSQTPFLDIASRVTSGGETGLLGLTFHPNYAQNHRFFVNYTRTNAGQLQTVIAEYATTLANPNLADANSEHILLVVNQPFDNHKAGQLGFGPDGFLYFGLGDGGSGGDPIGNGQNKQVLLGKMLRIDVDHPPAAGKQYAIPADNPFANGGGQPEIFAFGFRNPWRFSFDSATGRLFVADVGQDAFEEIDIVTNGGDYGWNIMEGTHCFNPSTNCNMTGLTLPIHDYPRSDGTTVIGGFVYHGSAISGLQGTYVFGDFGSGRIWMLTENTSTHKWSRTDLLSAGLHMSSFGQDQSGELYVVDYAGAVLQVRGM